MIGLPASHSQCVHMLKRFVLYPDFEIPLRCAAEAQELSTDFIVRYLSELATL